MTNVDIGNMFAPTFGFKIHSNFKIRNKITEIFAILLIFYFPTRENFAPPYTSPNMAQNLLSDWLCAPLLYTYLPTHFCYQKLFIVEAHISDEDPIGNLQGIRILITLVLNYGQEGTDSATTHVVALSAKVKRNEWLKRDAITDSRHK